MAYRNIHTRIWKDPWFLDLPPDAKLLFLWLCTNEQTNIVGVYEFSAKVAAFEVDSTPAEVMRVLQSFQADGKVLLDGTWIWVKNLLRYNATNMEGPKVKAHILNTLTAIGDTPLRSAFLERYPMDTLSVFADRVSATEDRVSANAEALSPVAVAEQSRTDTEQVSEQSRASTEQNTPDVRAALLPAANIAALAAAGIGEPERSDLSALPFMEPDYLSAWQADLSGRYEEVKPGLLVHCLRSGQWPDPPKKRKGGSNGNGRKGSAYLCGVCHQSPCACDDWKRFE